VDLLMDWAVNWLCRWLSIFVSWNQSVISRFHLYLWFRHLAKKAQSFWLQTVAWELSFYPSYLRMELFWSSYTSYSAFFLGHIWLSKRAVLFDVHSKSEFVAALCWIWVYYYLSIFIQFILLAKSSKAYSQFFIFP